MRSLAGLSLVLGLCLAGASSAEEPPAAGAPESGGAPAVEQAPAEDPSGSSDYDEFDELYFDEDFAEQDEEDPFEGFNRGIFWFNDGLDQHVIKPAATAWDYVLPDFAERALRNAFDNLRFPINFFNDIFQLKFRYVGEDVARFAMNVTVGIGGLMDPAAAVGLEKRVEDFGQTLGYWGVPPGPYLMLPFFGPSNVRDTGGLVVDSGMRAVGFFIPYWASMAMTAVDTLNRRSLIREALDAERAAALDWYAAVRSAYSQYRENLIRDRRQGAETDFQLFPPVEIDEQETSQ